MDKKEILADLEQIKSSLEELETQRDEIQILCIKSELELSIESILSDYKRVLKENKKLKLKYQLLYNGKIEKQKAQELKMPSLFVSKQKIKDKIEELKQKAIKYGNFIDKDESFNIESKISILQELLGDK